MSSKHKLQDIRELSDKEKFEIYDKITEKWKQGKTVDVREHKSGFPAVEVHVNDVHILTDILSIEEYWSKINDKDPKEVSNDE